MNLEDLKKQFPVKWRIQSINKNVVLCVAYIDARDVENLLDKVCGMANWQSRIRVEKGNLYTELSIKVGDEWIVKSDVGVPSKIEGEKGEVSDSLKRAAVQWGVGRFIYDLDIQKLPVIEKGKLYPVTLDKKKILYSGKDLTAYLNQRVNLASDLKSEVIAFLNRHVLDVYDEDGIKDLFNHFVSLKNDSEFLKTLQKRVKEIRNE